MGANGLIRYSKAADAVIAAESGRREQDDALRDAQMEISERLLGFTEPRRHCILCREDPLDGETFAHRRVPYVSCRHCGHVQTASLVPATYAFAGAHGVTYESIYPELNRRDYGSRRDKIYAPKLQWIVAALGELGIPIDTLRAWTWLELGCGAGYFLSALEAAGMRRCSGLDADRRLVEIANRNLGRPCVRLDTSPPEHVLRENAANVYVAFFLLEHLSDPHAFFTALRRLPAGSVFVFAVPTFGLSTLLEGAFDTHYARQLDNVFHTQLYTDRSIESALRLAGFRIAAQWVFGQDSLDFVRFMLLKARDRFSKPLVDQLQATLYAMVDPLQQVVDRAFFADSRHVIAVRD